MDYICRKLGRLEQKYPDVFLQILSVHYPFKHEIIDRYWNVIFIGDCFTSFFISDMDKFQVPNPGLCYNKNIEWNEWLLNHFILFDTENIEIDEKFEFYTSPLSTKEKNRNKVQSGFWNPFEGMYVGIPPDLPIYFQEEYDSLTGNIGLFETLSSAGIFHLPSNRNALLYKNEILKEFNNAEISIELIEIFIENKIETILFCNQSIWTNFLSKYYNDEIVEDFLKKYEKEYKANNPKSLD